MINRLTKHYVYFDGQHGYEALGHDAYSQRPFIEITKKLALYEDTGYTPKEVAELRDKLLGNTAEDWMGMYHIVADRADKAEAENAKLRRVVDAAKDHLNTVVGSKAFNQTDIALGYALAKLDKDTNGR